jgi:NAD(P)H-hydrate epimerase
MPPAFPLHDRRTLRAIEADYAGLGDGDDVLMRRAGEAAWRELRTRWPQASRILVACGAGNNGGDGYALATAALSSACHVDVVQIAPPRSDAARRALERCVAAGGRPTLFDGRLPDADVVVDALFGIGLADAPDASASQLIEAINRHSGAILALDVPSGVDAETGHVPGAAVRADRTLQFIAAHVGLSTGAALDHSGDLDVASLDVAIGAYAPRAFALRAPALSHWLPRRARDSHKGKFGHVLCVGGDHGRGGAIILCAEAALRTGAGLVSVATRESNVPPVLARRPEAMVAAIERAGDMDALVDAASVIAMGPGLGTQAWGLALWNAAMDASKPCVVDADALNLLATSHRTLDAGTILTPHPGEAGRLLGIGATAVQADRFGAASALVERFGCVVVLKGAGTIVAGPGATPCVIDAGNPGMAVGGMGDLLTGVIAALRAQGLAAFDAACCGALLHALAGDAAASQGGQRGLLPTDLLPALRTLSNPRATP